MSTTGTLLFILALPLLLGALFGLAFALYGWLLGPDGGSAMIRHAPLLYAGFLVVPLLVLLIAAGGLARLDDWFPAELGLDEDAIWLAVLLGAAFGVVLYLLDLAAAVRVRRHLRDGAARDVLEGGTRSLPGSQVAGAPLVIAVVVISVAEEVLWRGFLLEGAREGWGLSAFAALALASVSFGVNHWYFGLQNVALKTLHGAVWGALVLVTGALWVAVISHVVFSLWATLRLTVPARSRGGERNDEHRDRVRAAVRRPQLG